MICYFSQFSVLVSLIWVVLLFQVVLAKVTYLAALIWALIWVLCWSWNVQHDLSHIPEALGLTINWGALVLFH